MKIIVKSNPENWAKELSGLKPNTVRKLDGNDEIIIERTSDGARFERTITDITIFDGRIIISFKHKDGA